MSMPRPAALLLAIAAAAAGAYGLMLAWADWLSRTGKPTDLALAIKLAPNNADYRARAGQWSEAVRLNPYFATGWIRLGLEAEANGDYGLAERLLLKAAAVDRSYEPRWTLANYYFRRGMRTEFRKWSKLAAERSYGDRTALFRLFWEAEEGPSAILEALPRERELLLEYGEFLVQEKRWQAAAGAARRAAEYAVLEDTPRLGAVVEGLAQAPGATEAAVNLWNYMIQKKLLPFGPLDPATGIVLTNGGWRTPPSGRGFDWRPMFRKGVSNAWSSDPPGFRVTFTGGQEEKVVILEQWLPLCRRLEWMLKASYRTRGFPRRSGLRWVIRQGAGGGAELARSGDLSSEEWAEAKATFRGAGLAQLELVYDRAPGTSRLEGALMLGEVRIIPCRGSRTEPGTARSEDRPAS